MNKELSKRNYILIMGLLIAGGFSLVAFGSILISDPFFSDFSKKLNESVFTPIVCLIVSIIGCIVQWYGAKNNNPKISLLGYLLISSTLGLITALLLQYYDIQTITAAFIGTIVVALVFGILGFIFPNFFERIHGILLVSLLAVIIAEVLLIIFGINQGVTDWIVLLIFCGFIGYDFYQSMQVEYTVNNAIMFATEIYLDLINIFIRLLSILKEVKD